MVELNIVPIPIHFGLKNEGMNKMNSLLIFGVVLLLFYYEVKI